MHLLLQFLPGSTKKKTDVSVNKSIWFSTTLVTITYIVFGILAAAAFPVSNTTNILDRMNEFSNKNKSLHILHLITVWTLYLFPVVGFINGIPIYSVIVRYNLIENKICKKHAANFWAVIVPWIIALPVYAGAWFQIFVNWTSLLFNGVINFIIPVLMFMYAAKYTTAIRYSMLSVNIFQKSRESEFNALPATWNKLRTAKIVLVFLTIATVSAIAMSIWLIISACVHGFSLLCLTGESNDS